jgi:aryl-alcohol dehydrogenase-like predicted oxidoreductase
MSTQPSWSTSRRAATAAGQSITPVPGLSWPEPVGSPIDRSWFNHIASRPLLLYRRVALAPSTCLNVDRNGTMQYTRLGSSGLKISRIALGCMSFGTPSQHAPWTLDEAAAGPIFQEALELGITFWDTANVYGQGGSEDIVGRALKRYTHRDEIVLATKVFFPTGSHGPGRAGLSRRAILEQVDASLKRLGTDYVDLYQIHRYDPDTPAEETMEALHDIVKAGKVRYVGASSMLAWRFAKLQHAAQSNGWTKFVSMQDQYSLLRREEEREMFGLLADQGVGSIPWGPLAGGTLARPWGQDGTPRADSSRGVDPQGRPLLQNGDELIVGAVQQIAEARGVSMAQIAMAWVLANTVVSAPIIGATKPHHLSDAVAALDVRLTDDECRAIEDPYTPREPTFF